MTIIQALLQNQKSNQKDKALNEILNKCVKFKKYNSR